jgi:hypothetical protein
VRGRVCAVTVSTLLPARRPCCNDRITLSTDFH